MDSLKLCLKCNLIIDIEAERCPACGGTEFEEIDMTPEWNSIEPYLEAEDE